MGIAVAVPIVPSERAGVQSLPANPQFGRAVGLAAPAVVGWLLPRWAACGAQAGA
jgi:hypothetical protein